MNQEMQEKQLDSVAEAAAAAASLEAEVEILRGELARAKEELGQLQQQMGDFRERFLRARADLENYRRRSQQELERAREAGLDSAVLAMLVVFDDLERALTLAGQDPAHIIPGVTAVRDSLKRNLELLGISPIGAPGEPFNPELHEAINSLPGTPEQSGTIAEVVQVGFVKDERLIRPARVAVYQ
jgi:molecular chaperone GrpE